MLVNSFDCTIQKYSHLLTCGDIRECYVIESNSGVLMFQAVKLSEIVELAKTVSVDVQFELPI